MVWSTASRMPSRNWLRILPRKDTSRRRDLAHAHGGWVEASNTPSVYWPVRPPRRRKGQPDRLGPGETGTVDIAPVRRRHEDRATTVEHPALLKPQLRPLTSPPAKGEDLLPRHTSGRHLSIHSLTNATELRKIPSTTGETRIEFCTASDTPVKSPAIPYTIVQRPNPSWPSIRRSYPLSLRQHRI